MIGPTWLQIIKLGPETKTDCLFLQNTPQHNPKTLSKARLPERNELKELLTEGKLFYTELPTEGVSIPMNCFKFHSPLLPLHSDCKHRQHLIRHTKLPCLASNNLSRTLQQSLRFPSPSPPMAKALPHSIVIAASSPSKSVDMSVFLQTSALLFFLYFTANFIVPELISKYFGFDNVKKDQKVDIDPKKKRRPEGE